MKQDRQALLKPKYYPRVATHNAQRNAQKKPMWPWPLSMTLKFIKLSEAVHELSCPQTFCPISQWWKIRKSGPVTLSFDLRSWNSLGF